MLFDEVDSVQSEGTHASLQIIIYFLVIEKYTENVRFCIICNYLSKIIPALQSRCTRFRFAPLMEEQILPRLDYVVDQEKLVYKGKKGSNTQPNFNVTYNICSCFRIKIDQTGKKALIKLSNGDMRRVLNILQSTWFAYKNVTEENVYSCVGHPTPENITSILNWLLSTDDFKECYDSILLFKTTPKFHIAPFVIYILV